jgi:hypothetical protein
MAAAGTPICLVMKAVLPSARWAGRSQRPGMEQATKDSGDVAEVKAENVVFRDTVEFLTKWLACAERRLKAATTRMPCSPAERLHILWCIEHFGIPRRRQIPKCPAGSVMLGRLHGRLAGAPGVNTRVCPVSEVIPQPSRRHPVREGAVHRVQTMSRTHLTPAHTAESETPRYRKTRHEAICSASRVPDCYIGA